MNNLAGTRIVNAQDRPALAVGLVQLKLELGAHDLVRGRFGVDGAEEAQVGGVALAVGGAQVEGDAVGAQGDGAGFLVDLLEEEGGDDRGGGLVEVGAGAWSVCGA